jgi:hypothetical protein
MKKSKQNDIKMPYSCPEDILLSYTERVWDLSSDKGHLKEENVLGARMFLWPNKELQKKYSEDILEVMVSEIINVTEYTDENRIEWPVNRIKTEEDLLKTGDIGRRYVLGVPKVFKYSEAKQLFSNVEKTISYRSGNYVK